MSRDQPQQLALLWGVRAIADYIGRSERQTYYLIEKNLIRGIKRVGPKTLVGNPAEIDASLKSETA